MRRVLATTLLLLTVTGCTADPAPSESSAPGGRTAGCASAASAPGGGADAVDVAGQIGQKGEADYAAVFAGARVADDGTTVDVYRKASADFDKWVLDTFASSCVVLNDAKFSAAELAKRYQQVNDDHEYWSGQGVAVNSVSSDFVRGVVIVGTDEPDKAAPLFKTRYADGVPVEIVKEAPA
ncbi:hypothetical protein KZZ52_48795 [Dactylosporangium sp. AC04546]|uniref:hypothetical protein n=1 Tax=Dactylosporangium sp. AC04546 TaxID=2862460 RepID=UPI001EDFE3D0|nr:hypothetical protein [Dactylosporangium sp. AC04546]WVK81790.1 hypothetical protein KZZ52_48795 [Dactylosporangium sp. AC04546]